MREALAAFNQRDGLIGGDASVGAIKALMTMANDDGADSQVDRIEAVIASLRTATGQDEKATVTPEVEPLPPAGYLSLRVDDARRTITRDGFTATVNLQASALQWAIFKKLAGNRDVPLAPEAIRAIWATHGVAPDPSDGTVNDTVSQLRAALKPIGVTIVSRRKLGRLLAAILQERDRKGANRKQRRK